VLEIRYYLAPDGRSPFEGWFSSLDPTARAKVTVAIARLEQGNLSNVKGVGEGCSNIGLISGRDTGCISGAMGRRW
jgi:putative component of toxin-antitoxin plasmid stabilization module